MRTPHAPNQAIRLTPGLLDTTRWSFRHCDRTAPAETRKKPIAKALVAALLAGPWTLREMVHRSEEVLGTQTRGPQARTIPKLLEDQPARHPPTAEWPTDYLLLSSWLKEAAVYMQNGNARAPVVVASSAFIPAPLFRGLEIPHLATSGALAARRRITISDLVEFACRRKRSAETPIPGRQHYANVFNAKASGPPRSIEQPKLRLKAMQRQILREILDQVPSHDAAHGFVQGRSCLTGAQLHCGEAAAITADLTSIFVTTPLGRVHALFCGLG